jgi:myo-inositol catabolism protein IolC
MTLGYDRPLYILAFDHRGSFKKVFGFSGDLTPEQHDKMSDGKMLIFEGVQRAIADGSPREATGILVDEEFGADILRRAKKEDMVFAMPAEKSGQDEFDFEHGDDFGAHIEEFDPTFTKVLVRYNPEGDAETNARQIERLKRLSDWLHANDRKFLFELLVPAEPAQLERVDGDEERYDTEIRPGLMLTSVIELQLAGVEPDVWKIEGIDEREDCQKIAVQARSHGRDQVACVVLGRGADDAKVEHWLRAGAGLPGYIGFAIGRTIWSPSLKKFLAGELDREAAAKAIGDSYRHFIEVWETATAEQATRGPEPRIPARPNPPTAE